MTVAELLTRLDAQQEQALIEALAAGLEAGTLAAQCVRDLGTPHQETELLAYLTQAIERLETARELVRQRA
jgi:hypothetical protein